MRPVTIVRMLSKSRIFAVLTLLLACGMVAAGLLMPKLVTEDRPVPLELQSSALTLRDDDATVGPAYLAPGEKDEIKAPVSRQFKMTIGEPNTEDTAAARVGVSSHRDNVKNDLESLLDAQVWSFRMNRFTGVAEGKATIADTPGTPPGKGEVPGQWAKFPTNTEQRDYTYFDWTARKDFPATFVRTETRQSQGKDVEVYVFHQDIPDTNIAQQYHGFRNTMTTEDGKQAYLHHGGQRELVVEPKSGMLISVAEDIRDVYRDSQGKEVQKLLEFNGKVDSDIESSMLAQAMRVGEKRQVEKWSRILLWAGLALGVVALAVAPRPGSSTRRQPKVAEHSDPHSVSGEEHQEEPVTEEIAVRGEGRYNGEPGDSPRS